MLDGCVPWPPELAASYRAAGYWTDETLDVLITAHAAEHPDRVALAEADGSRLTYAELEARIAGTAGGLRAFGIGDRDRAVVQLPNVAEFVVLCFALMRIGAIPVLALPAHRQTEIVDIARLSDATAYVVPDADEAGFDYRELARTVREAVPSVRHVLVAGDPAEFTPVTGLVQSAGPQPAEHRPDPGDVALFLLSGGTTGTPKLIPRTHNDYLYNARASAGVCGFDRDTVYLVALPVAHNFAFACPGVLGTFASGGTVVLAANPSPDEAFPLIEREKVTVTAVVPPIALLWMDAAEWDDADISSLQLLQVGGSKLSAEPAGRVRGTLRCSLQQVFGMAEGLLNYTRPDDPDDLVITTQGRPLSPADEVLVLDSEGNPVLPGEPGELATRGPYTLRGYYRSPEHNAKAFTPEGFYRSGDLVRSLPSGHLVVEGRVKDQINRGGDKIAAEELENHILAHPAVHDVAVVGMSDPVLGERTCAFVVPRTGSGAVPELRELTAFLRERGMAGYKLPDRLEIVDSFPMTTVGKVSKKALEKQIAATISTEHATGERTTTA